MSTTDDPAVALLRQMLDQLKQVNDKLDKIISQI